MAKQKTEKTEKLLKNDHQHHTVANRYLLLSINNRDWFPSHPVLSGLYKRPKNTTVHRLPRPFWLSIFTAVCIVTHIFENVFFNTCLANLQHHELPILHPEIRFYPIRGNLPRFSERCFNAHRFTIDSFFCPLLSNFISISS